MRIAVAASAWALVTVLLTGCDPASLYGPLTGQWSEQTSGYPIAAKPAVGEQTVYLGSWDGNEYAFDEASGAVQWKAYLLDPVALLEMPADPPPGRGAALACRVHRSRSPCKRPRHH